MPEFKFNAIFGLQPGIDADETYEEWRGEPAAWVRDKTPPEGRRYTINKVIHKHPPASGGVPRFDILNMTLQHCPRVTSTSQCPVPHPPRKSGGVS